MGGDVVKLKQICAKIYYKESVKTIKEMLSEFKTFPTIVHHTSFLKNDRKINYGLNVPYHYFIGRPGNIKSNVTNML